MSYKTFVLAAVAATSFLVPTMSTTTDAEARRFRIEGRWHRTGHQRFHVIDRNGKSRGFAPNKKGARKLRQEIRQGSGGRGNGFIHEDNDTCNSPRTWC